MKIDVKKVAKLANLQLTPEEEEKYSGQLSKILEYVEKLNEVNTDNIEPTYNVSGLSNVLRPDEVGDCTITQKDAISNAPKKKDGFIITKGVFEE